VASRLKRERDQLLEEWIIQLKKRQDAQMSKNSGDNQENKSQEELKAMRQKVKEELSVEYDRRLSEVETRLKSELESLEAREESLTNELQARESALEGERSKVKESMDILESELQCSICSELFINAVTLGCAHTFCEFCINSWKRKPYSHHQCPICRSSIKLEIKSLVLDQYIERIVDKMDPDLAEVRRELIVQRKELEEKEALKEKLDRDSSTPINQNSSLPDISTDSMGSGGNASGGGGYSTNVHSRINMSTPISGGSHSSGSMFSPGSRSSGGHRYGGGRDNVSRGGNRNSGGSNGGGGHRGANRYGNHGNGGGHHSGNSNNSNRGYAGGSGGNHRSSMGGGAGSSSHHGNHNAGYRGPFRYLGSCCKYLTGSKMKVIS